MQILNVHREVSVRSCGWEFGCFHLRPCEFVDVVAPRWLILHLEGLGHELTRVLIDVEVASAIELVDKSWVHASARWDLHVVWRIVSAHWQKQRILICPQEIVGR